MRQRLLPLLAAAAVLVVLTLLNSLSTVSAPSHEYSPSPIIHSSSPTIQPDNTAPPPPPSPTATCDALDSHAVELAASRNAARVVFASFANHAQLDFMLNWIAHLDVLQLAGSALVGATDDATVAGLIAARTRARCFPLTSAIGAAEAKWGSPGFSQMGRTKSKLLRTLLTMHATVLFADADVAFLRDPLPYIQTQIALGADVLFHTDGFGSSPFAKLHGDSALEQPSFGWGPELNTGLFLATPKALKLSEEWCEVLKSDAAFANWKNDQQTLNELMRQGVRISPPSDARSTNLIDAFNGRLKLGLLPSHLFPSGHVYFIQRQLRSIQDTAPYAIHLTFQNCDQSGKRHRMREARLWMVDPPSYYNPPNGLLSYTPDLPPELTSQFNSTSALPQTRNLHGSDAVLASHFALINHQLLQVRTALALALVLNRTLVLPRFLCGLETVTNFAHSGVRCRGSKGCATILPYYCPADHVLRMHYIAGVMPQVPQVPIRILEHSSLRNEASPSHDPNKVLLVDVVGGAAGGEVARPCVHCNGDEGAYLTQGAGGGPRVKAARETVAATAISTARQAGARTLQLPAGVMSEDEVKAKLGVHTATTTGLIHISSLRPHGGGLNLKLDAFFSDRRRAQAFTETVKPLGGGWCCVEAERRGAFGHYWYDALFDQPHTDRFNRRWGSERPWVPTPGP